MNNKVKLILISIFAVFILGAVILSPLNIFSNNNTSTHNVNSTQAIEIVLNQPNATDYYNQHFRISELRVNNTTLVYGNVPNMNNIKIATDEPIWKVNIMERTCACSGIQPLYVIEGYVSATSGQCLNLSTKEVSEAEFPMSTCASTLCH